MNILRQIAAFDAAFKNDPVVPRDSLREDTTPRDQDTLDQQVQVGSEVDTAMKDKLIASLADVAKKMIQIGRKLPTNTT